MLVLAAEDNTHVRVTAEVAIRGVGAVVSSGGRAARRRRELLGYR